jgi:pimeloyl-ACP methyl ester carboxylesterase
MKIYLKSISFCLLLLSFISCSESNLETDTIVINPSTKIEGTGFIEFSEYPALADKIIKLFFHVPKSTSKNTPIVFVFHGDGRNAKEYRDAVIKKANEFNFIVIAPEFSNTNFPTGDSYNLGNVFVDGDNPSPETLVSEEKWTFSAIEPIFDFVKVNLANTSEKYTIIGHSAGAQFALRFAMFKPAARFNKMVASASGWYTATDFSVDFPYGFKESPLEEINLSNFFSKEIYLQVGELDNNKNESGLRRNEFADAQGNNRYARAYYFYNKAKKLAENNTMSFTWKIQTNKGLNHDFKPALEKSIDLLFK